MKIEQLKYLIEIGHSRSISSAAGKLYLSHTTLSSILKGAEKELGFPLFQRIQEGREGDRRRRGSPGPHGRNVSVF